MLNRVKLALRITTDAFDDEITGLISAALLDLGVGDISDATLADPDELVTLAVVTYVKMHFGQPEEYDRLKASYWEQKAQLITSGKYGTYGGANG